MTSRLSILPPMLAVLIVAGLGFAWGPMAALAAVAGFAGLLVVGLLASGNVSINPSLPKAQQHTIQIESDAPLYSGLGWAIGLALLLRVIVVLAINSTSAWISFAPDADYWEGSGTALLAHWSDSAVPLDVWFNKDAQWPFYSIFNGVVVAVFGSARYPASFINAGISVLAAYVFGAISQRVYGRDAGRRTFLMSLFFPSVVLWSCMNIREAWSILVIGLVLLFAHRLRSRFSPADAAMLLSAIAAMFFIRSYLVPLLTAGVALSYLVVRMRQVPYAIAMLVILLAFGLTVGPDLGLDPAILSSDSLEAVDDMRRNLAFGGSAYGGGADTRTLAGSLAYLPEGVTRFVLGPFPWAVHSWRQVLTVPESLVWYWVVALTIWRLGGTLRTKLVRVAPTFFVLVLVTCAYGLVSGNEGTAYRHRAQIMVLFFVLVSDRPVFSGSRRR